MPSTPPLKRLRSSDQVSEGIYINRIEDDDEDDDESEAVDETLRTPSASNPAERPDIPSSSSYPPESSTLADSSFARDLSDVRGCLRDIAATLTSLDFHDVLAPSSGASLPAPAPPPTLISKWNVWIQVDMNRVHESFFQRDLYKVYCVKDDDGGGGGAAPSAAPPPKTPIVYTSELSMELGGEEEEEEKEREERTERGKEMEGENDGEEVVEEKTEEWSSRGLEVTKDRRGEKDYEVERRVVDETEAIEGEKEEANEDDRKARNEIEGKIEEDLSTSDDGENTIRNEDDTKHDFENIGDINQNDVSRQRQRHQREQQQEQQQRRIEADAIVDETTRTTKQSTVGDEGVSREEEEEEEEEVEKLARAVEGIERQISTAEIVLTGNEFETDAVEDGSTSTNQIERTEITEVTTSILVTSTSTTASTPAASPDSTALEYSSSSSSNSEKASTTNSKKVEGLITTDNDDRIVDGEKDEDDEYDGERSLIIKEVAVIHEADRFTEEALPRLPDETEMSTAQQQQQQQRQTAHLTLQEEMKEEKARIVRVEAAVSLVEATTEAVGEEGAEEEAFDEEEARRREEEVAIAEAGLAEAEVTAVTAEGLVVGQEVTRVMAEAMDADAPATNDVAAARVSRAEGAGDLPTATTTTTVLTLAADLVAIDYSATALDSTTTAGQTLNDEASGIKTKLETAEESQRTLIAIAESIATVESGADSLIASSVLSSDSRGERDAERCEYDIDEEDEEEEELEYEDNLSRERIDSVEGVLVSEVSPEELSQLSARIPGLISSHLTNEISAIPEEEIEEMDEEPRVFVKGEISVVPDVKIFVTSEPPPLTEEETIFEECTFVSESEPLEASIESSGEGDEGSGRYEPIESPLCELYEGVDGYDGRPRLRSEQSDIYESVQVQKGGATLEITANATLKRDVVEKTEETKNVVLSDSECDPDQVVVLISTDQKTWVSPDGAPPPPRPKRNSRNEYDNVPMEEGSAKQQEAAAETVVKAVAETIERADSTEASVRKPARYGRRNTSSISDRPGLNLGSDRMEIDVESEEEEEDEDEEAIENEAATLTSQRPRGKLVRSVGGSFAEEELDVVGNKSKVESECSLLSSEEGGDAEGSISSSQRPRGKLVRGVGGSFAEEELDILQRATALEKDNSEAHEVDDDLGKGIDGEEEIEVDKSTKTKTGDTHDESSDKTPEHFEDLQPYEVLSGPIHDASAKGDAHGESFYEVVVVEPQESKPNECVVIEDDKDIITKSADLIEGVVVYDTVPTEAEVPEALPDESLDSACADENKSESYFDVVLMENDTTRTHDDEVYENVSILNSIPHDPSDETRTSVDENGKITSSEMAEEATPLTQHIENLEDDDAQSASELPDVSLSSLEEKTEIFSEQPLDDAAIAAAQVNSLNEDNLSSDTTADVDKAPLVEVTHNVENATCPSLPSIILKHSDESGSHEQIPSSLTVKPEQPLDEAPIAAAQVNSLNEDILSLDTTAEVDKVIKIENQVPAMDNLETEALSHEVSTPENKDDELIVSKEEITESVEVAWNVENATCPSLPCIILEHSEQSFSHEQTPSSLTVEPPSPIFPLQSVAQRQMRKYSSSTSIASEEEEEAKVFESHFESMSEEAETILRTEPVAVMVKVLDKKSQKPSEKFCAKNRSTASSLASEEEAEATIFEGHFESVAEEAQLVLESESVAPIVAGLHGKGPASSMDDASRRSADDERDVEDDGLAETLESIEFEEAQLDEILDAAEDMDRWRPKGVERRRGQELSTPFLVKKKKRLSEQRENEVSEFEEHERRLEQLSSNIDKILAPLAANELIDDDEDLLRVGLRAPLATSESLLSLSSEVPSREEEEEEEEPAVPARWSFFPRCCCPRWWSSPSSTPFSWFSPFKFLTAAT